MRRHHRRDARLDRGPERGQFDLVQAFERMPDHRQPEVRIDVGVAMTGKVLDAGDDPRIGQTPDRGEGSGDHLFDRVPERSGTDHRVVGIVVDIDNRGEVDVDPALPQLDTGDPGRFFNV